jgi:hypothetical protein
MILPASFQFPAGGFMAAAIAASTNEPLLVLSPPSLEALLLLAGIPPLPGIWPVSLFELFRGVLP